MRWKCRECGFKGKSPKALAIHRGHRHEKNGMGGGGNGQGNPFDAARAALDVRIQDHEKEIEKLEQAKHLLPTT